MKAIVGEFAERRLQRELRDHPPDVAIAFDPGSAAVLGAARDESPRPAPVVTVVPDLSPNTAWQGVDADRFLVIDDEAAVELADVGIPGERILPVGPLGEVRFAEAASSERAALRQRFKLPASEPIVLIEVEGLGHDTTSQLALQLSLLERRATYLFAAGSDIEAATALRRQVPTLDMRAKLFGATADAPHLWRCADVIVTRPRPRAIMRAMLVGAHIVAFSPDDEQGRELAAAMEARGLGASAGNVLLIASVLEPLLTAPARARPTVGIDGAAVIADVAWIVGSEREAVIDERAAAVRAQTRARVESVASAAHAAARASAAPGELEDLSGDVDTTCAPPDTPGPDLAEIVRLRADLSARAERLRRTAADAQRRVAEWQKKHDTAAKQGAADMAREAERNGDLERTRMHSALSEMAQIQEELAKLATAEETARSQPSTGKARSSSPRAEWQRRGGGTSVNADAPPPPSVDDLLEQMKRQKPGTDSGTAQGTAPPPRKRRKPKSDSTVDDELAALKKKMAARDPKKRGEP
jgi:UDP-N-acetylglucosamine:LPS N-acetylglucosamine transferase